MKRKLLSSANTSLHKLDILHASVFYGQVEKYKCALKSIWSGCGHKSQSKGIRFFSLSVHCKILGHVLLVQNCTLQISDKPKSMLPANHTKLTFSLLATSDIRPSKISMLPANHTKPAFSPVATPLRYSSAKCENFIEISIPRVRSVNRRRKE